MSSRRKSGRAQVTRLLFKRGKGRFYLDLREFGLGREALIPPGESYATTDEVVAVALAAERLREVLDERQSGPLGERRRIARLGEFAHEWLEEKRRLAGGEGYTQLSTLDRYERALKSLFQVLDQDHRVDKLTRRDVKAAVADLRRLPSRTGGMMSSSSVRQAIIAMQQIYDHASDSGIVPEDYNPWRQLRRADRPKLPRTSSTDFLETYEAWAMLEASDRLPGIRIPIRPILASYLYTGGRRDEVLGLEVSDVDFRRKTVRFRTNRWRRIKVGEERTVPLWPGLERELRPYLAREGRISGLLFPSPRSPHGEQRMIRRVRPLLVAIRDLAADALGSNLGPLLRTKKVHPRALRPTYCAARLQTVDGGEAIAIWTVRAEMGHSSLAMINRVYGRLGEVRHRSPVVEYVPLDDETREQLLGVHGVIDN